MNGRHLIDLGFPSVLAVRGPDAERYLNGQITQDVRLVRGGRLTLPACVTDAKGRLQFRVWISGAAEGGFLVQGEPGDDGPLEERLSRYLIADDAEILPVSGEFRILHLTGNPPPPPDDIIARECSRFLGPGVDWWVPSGSELRPPDGWQPLEGPDFDAFRIRRGVPAWGRELVPGLLPPEAGLDATDVSYQKGCYIGQEVISRMKRAGKTNKRLIRMGFADPVPEVPARLETADGGDAGGITSVSPLAQDGVFHALGYLKRGVTACFAPAPGGLRQQADIA